MAVLLSVALVAQAAEPQEDTPSLVLFTNVMIFDGVTDKLVNGDVLVKDNLIEQISSEPLSVIATANTTTIDGGGRTLMPGLIESHVHLNLQHMIGGDLAALTGKNNPTPINWG